MNDYSHDGLPCLLGDVQVPTPTEPGAIDNYSVRNACGGPGNGGLEAIAHARFVNRLNTDQGVRSALGLSWSSTATSGQVDLGIQWESQLDGLQGAYGGSGRPDILVYDPSPQSAGVIRVAEVKTAGGPGISRVYEKQIVPYRNWIEGKASGRAGLLDVTGYDDTFSVCGVRYDVAEEDPSSGQSDYNTYEDDAMGPNALLVVTASGDVEPPAQQVADSEEPSSCPTEVPVDGSNEPWEPGNDEEEGSGSGGSSWNQAEWDAFLETFQCSVDLYSEKVTEAAKVGSKPWTVPGLLFQIVKKAADALRNPPKDRCPPVPGAWGDPHLTSLDGMAFDMQSVGEFTLVKAPEIGFDLQGRFTPWGDSDNASVLSGLAFRLNGYEIEMDGDGGLLVDGRPYSIDEGDSLYFNGGAFVSRVGDEYVVFTNRQQSRGVVFSWGGTTLRIIAAPDLVTSGVLGNNDGDPTNDLKSRDGESPTSISAGYLHTRFAQSWRIDQMDSHFTYAPGVSTATFTDLSFPSSAVNLEDFPSDEVEDAYATCELVQEGSARDACALDVLVTGSTHFLEEALAASSAPVSALPLELDDSGPAIADFGSTVPLNFAPSRRMKVDGVGEVAGPFPSGSTYQFDLPIAANHSGIHLSMEFVVSGALTAARSRSLEVEFGRAFADSIRVSRSGAVAAEGVVSGLGTGTSANGTPWRRYRYTVALPAAAASLSGHVTAFGWSRFQSDRIGISAFKFDLLQPSPAPWREIAINETVWPDPTIEGVNGIITARGERERYRFSLEYPTQLGLGEVYGRDLQNFCETSVLVHRTSGRRMDACFFPTDGEDPVILAPGDYELRVAAPEDAYLPMKFGVQLYQNSTPQTFSVDLDDEPVVFEPSDGTGAGVMPSPGGDEEYNLNVQQTGTLIVEVDCIVPAEDCISHRQLTLRRPDEEPEYVMVDSDRISSFPVGAGQNYIMRLPAMIGRREFKLTLRIATDETRQIALGQEVLPDPATGIGTLTERQPHEKFQFQIPAGGAVTYLDVLPGFMVSDRRSGKLVCEFWRITDESGNRLDSCMFYGAWLDEGTYTVTVRAPWKVELPFTYGFSIYTAQQTTDQEFNLTTTGPSGLTAANPIHVDSDITTGRAHLDNGRSVDKYRFTVNDTGMPVVTVTCGSNSAPEPINKAECVTGGVSRLNQWRMLPAAPGAEYEIVVNRRGTGSLSYDLDISLDPTFEYTIGQTVANGSHGLGTGNLSPQAPVDLYRVEVPSDGEYALALDHDSDHRVDVTLYEATTGTEAPVWVYPGSSSYLSAGEYLLAVESKAPDYEENLPDIAYRVRLAAVAPPVPAAISLDSNGAGAATGSLTGPEYDQYTVTISNPGDYAIQSSPGVHAYINHAAEEGEWPEPVEYLTPTRASLQAGDYVIDVSNNDPGAFDGISYDVTLTPLGPVPTMQYAVGDRITSQTGNGAGVLADEADIDRYQFAIPDQADPDDEDPVGMDLALTQTGLDMPCEMLYLERDGEQYYFDCSSGFAQYFEPGDYVLDVFPFEGMEPETSYTLSLRTTSVTQTTQVTVSPEQLTQALPLRGQFTDDSDINEYEITVDEADVELTGWLVIELGEGCTDARLFEPGSTDAWSEGCQSIIRTAQAGTYRLQVAGAKDARYEYLAYLTDDVDPALWNNGGGGNT